MAAVSVFVDDAIRGDLPLVCAKTGEPTDLVIRRRQPVGSGVWPLAWLLVFFGPPGWLAMLVVVLLAPAQEYLTVRIPETEASYSQERQLQRWRLIAFGAGVFVPLLGLFGVGMFPLLWLAWGGAFLIAAGALHLAVWRQSIGVTIDVSRRWVTLTGVHPAFVEAVQRQEATPSRR